MIKDFLLPLLVLLALCAVSYELGHSKARSEGRAAMAELKAGLDRDEAEALRKARDDLREEARRAFMADFALQKERSAHALEKADFLARVPDVTRGSTRTFGPAFVGLWNEAMGAGRDAPDTAGSDAAACAAAASEIGGHRD